MSSSEKLQCRNVPFVLRYYEPNRITKPEDYAHHPLFLFYPFRDEADLLVDTSQSYVEKLTEPGVIDLILIDRKFNLLLKSLKKLFSNL